MGYAVSAEGRKGGGQAGAGEPIPGLELGFKNAQTCKAGDKNPFDHYQHTMSLDLVN